MRSPDYILDQQTTAVMAVSADLHILYLNQAAEALVEASGHRLLGEPLGSCFQRSGNTARDIHGGAQRRTGVHQTRRERADQFRCDRVGRLHRHADARSQPAGAADRNPAARPPAAHQPRRSPRVGAGDHAQARSRPRARNQESARRHSRRGTTAAARTRNGAPARLHADHHRRSGSAAKSRRSDARSEPGPAAGRP